MNSKADRATICLCSARHRISTGPNYDSIVDFSAAHDTFDVPTLPSSVTTLDYGSLSRATFDSDLSADLGFEGAGVAIVFTPDAGDLAGQTFLIVDENNQGGYQAGADIVVHLLDPANIGTITTNNFI